MQGTLPDCVSGDLESLRAAPLELVIDSFHPDKDHGARLSKWKSQDVNSFGFKAYDLSTMQFYKCEQAVENVNHLHNKSWVNPSLLTVISEW